jgi:uncharacterized membrane protein YfcA
VAAALVAGLARGFSGFGAALIFIPLSASVIGLRQAAPLMLLLELLAIVSLVRGAWHVAPRPETVPLVVGLVLGTPLGIWVLATADALALRWGVAGVILALLGLVMSGWRLRGGHGPAVPVAAGMVGGVLAGIATISGPPAMAYLLGRGLPARQVRAIFNLYLSAGDVLALAGCLFAGLVGPALLGPLAVTAPFYAAGIWAGSRMFGLASELTFRRICYGLIAVAAVLSLPVWDAMRR